jgi:hypothetical protein
MYWRAILPTRPLPGKPIKTEEPSWLKGFENMPISGMWSGDINLTYFINIKKYYARIPGETWI